MEENKKPKATLMQGIIAIVSIIGIILLIPVLFIEGVLMVNRVIHPDAPPSFMGYTPLVTLSGSMEPTLGVNDLIIVKRAEDPAALEEGTVITYMSGNILVTHRIVEITQSDSGETMYVTQGDANNVPDTVHVLPAQIVGAYATHIRGIGRFALFMQTPMGILTFVVLPIIILLTAYKIQDHKRYKALLKELEEQKAVTQVQE